MNEFIKLRKILCEGDNHYIFLQSFFEKYIKNNENIKINQVSMIDNLRKLSNWGHETNLKYNDICDMISALGDNEYLDRYISEIIINFFKNSEKINLDEIISSILVKREYNDLKLYNILDICIECNINALDKDELIILLDRYKKDYDLLTILIEYISTFKVLSLKKQIYELLKDQYPDNIEIQLLDLVKSMYSIDELKRYLQDEDSKINLNEELYKEYLEFCNTESTINKNGLIMMQSMFYGDFEDSGKGDNGGLAVFLKSLGNEMSKDERVSSIITITINQKLDKSFAKYYRDKHLFLRLPIYIDMSKKDPFIKRELFIKRYIYKILKRTNVIPDIFHIRYLDNASKAISTLRKELNKKLIFTLTPDPHRNMFDKYGKLIEFNFNRFMEKLNKIKIGYELLYESDGILGIGNIEVKKELELYFPQLSEKHITEKITMIGEGIDSSPYIDFKTEQETMKCLMETIGIQKEFFDKPIILNVGRLNSIKGQNSLLKAWGNSRLCETHNLLILGGDLENPNKEEQVIINCFKEYLNENPHLKDRFVHAKAIPNDNIMVIEKSIMRKELDYPHIYICSSIKEEFGIAILEAMVQKFLILAPINGGVKSYIDHGINGFLIDTSSWESIAKETKKIIYDTQISKEKFKEIQIAGHKTVEEFFSVKKIAKEFLSFYLSL